MRFEQAISRQNTVERSPERKQTFNQRLTQTIDSVLSDINTENIELSVKRNGTESYPTVKVYNTNEDDNTKISAEINPKNKDNSPQKQFRVTETILGENPHRIDDSTFHSFEAAIDRAIRIVKTQPFRQ